MINEVNVAHRNGIDFDGQFGRSMFTARDFVVEPALENSGPLDVSILTVPGLVDGVGDTTFRYNGRSENGVRLILIITLLVQEGLKLISMA
jgi:hypothetical protein